MNAEDVRRTWAERSGEFSPDYYAYRGPDATSEAVRRVLEDRLGPDASVCELGCSAGRHLAHLHEHGFTDLHGVDLNRDASDVMAAEFPSLADAVTFHHESIERAVSGFEDGRFDAVFSAETLQHLHADEAWAFGEIARVVGQLLVTVECERPVEGEPDAERTTVDGSFPLYYRSWDEVFGAVGLEEVGSRRLDRTTLRAFAPG